ncbi:MULTISPECIES: PIG-L deacetylase family protein [unclassified Viridibacillus]|uniref:PIG-L deacetylase family protein n=1 Tax=unclassified Viridibacillus TaxID=2617942 RepID=UPI00096E6878|nr:PIG-L deacetylase family protein [Viridibacillus sp. FSL H8-0123]OMC81686.1 GlcNAc-PI de-N-acetylase [Viridibacillus sp. FSL H8-0123]
MKRVIIVTPHPDDETLGCGGTLLKYKKENHDLYWLIVTGMGDSFTKERKQKRQKEIDTVANMYDFKEVFQLDFPAAELDCIPMGDIVGRISQVFSKVKPQIVFTPYPGDIHSDHKVVFDATMSCTKWFRYPSVERVLAYETLSETDFSIDPDVNGFRPNVYINIGGFLEEKIKIMNIYASEISAFPFPRSEKAIKSLAYLRGAASGYEEAEAFMLLKERIE